MNLSAKTIRISVILLALMLLGAGGFYGLVMHAQFGKISSIQSQIDEADEALIASKTQPNTDVDTRLNELKEQICCHVVDKKESLDFALYIQKLAQLAGASNFSGTHRINDSYISIDECDHIVEGRMQIKFEASFQQFASFVNTLERNRPVVFVDDFSISRLNGSSNKVSMTLCFLVAQDTIKSLAN